MAHDNNKPTQEFKEGDSVLAQNFARQVPCRSDDKT